MQQSIRTERKNHKVRPYEKPIKTTPAEYNFDAETRPAATTIVLNDEQQRAHDYVLKRMSWLTSGHRPTPTYLFVSGSAGTGKSFLLEKIVESMRRSFIKVNVVSCTGVAAANINARTIHSFLGLDFFGNFSLKENQMLSEMDVLIIDEVSLMSSNIFRAIDKCMQFHKKSNMAFGGLSVLLFGDLYQLMPVIKNGQDTPMYEAHELWGLFGFIELTQNMRQSDRVFVEYLNRIRLGNVDSKTLNYFNKFRVLTFKQTPDDVLRLYSTRAKVKDFNRKMAFKSVRNVDHGYKNVKYQTYNNNVVVVHYQRGDIGPNCEVWPAEDMDDLTKPVQLSVGTWVESKAMRVSTARIVFLDDDKIVVFGQNLTTISKRRVYFELRRSEVDDDDENNCHDKHTVAGADLFPVKVLSHLGVNNEPQVRTYTAVQDVVSIKKIQSKSDGEMIIYPSSNSISVPDKIDLCVGMVVMVTKNSQNGVCFNGMRCRILAMADEQLVMQHLDETQLILIMPMAIFYFTIDNDRDNVTRRFGFPIEHAWSCTIHKTQSLSVDQIELDPQGIFGAGQLYVALSRVRRSNGLILTSPITPKHVIVSEDVHNVYEKLRANKQISYE